MALWNWYMSRTVQKRVAIIAAAVVIVILVIGTISSLTDEDEDDDDADEGKNPTVTHSEPDEGLSTP
jgi:hypothetical protein